MNLVYFALCLLIPLFVLNTALHEGAHALLAKVFGAKIVQFHVLPGHYGPKKAFFFGYTAWMPRLTDGQTAAVLLAPKAANAIWLGLATVVLVYCPFPLRSYPGTAVGLFLVFQAVDFFRGLLQRSPLADVPRAIVLLR